MDEEMKALEELYASLRPQGPPKVWSVVESSKRKVNGKPVKFVIQEVPEDRYEDVVEYMATYFIPEEPVCCSFNGKDDPTFVKDFKEMWRKLLIQGFSVVAFVENPEGGKPMIAGANVIGVEFKDHELKFNDKDLSPRTRNVTAVIMSLSKQASVYEKYNVDKHMFALGLSVHPSYRGESLGGHILRARENIGREYKIPATSTSFTSPISQKLAERVGFETLLERDYDQITDSQGNLAFPNIKEKTFKIMAKRLY